MSNNTTIQLLNTLEERVVSLSNAFRELEKSYTILQSDYIALEQQYLDAFHKIKHLEEENKVLTIVNSAKGNNPDSEALKRHLDDVINIIDAHLNLLK